MFEFHDIEQNSDTWFDMRGGKLTSSNLGKIMANYGKAFVVGYIRCGSLNFRVILTLSWWELISL